MCLKSETAAVLRRHGRLDYDDYVGSLTPLFSESDYVIANLETPISRSNPLTDKSMQFNTDEALLKAVHQCGISFLATANNHCLDAGVIGLNETLDALERYGFDHDGTYRDEKTSNKIFIKEISDVRIAILSFTFGTNSEHNGSMLPSGEEWRVALLKKQNKLRRLPQSSDLDSGNFRTYIADDVLPAAIANPANQEFLDRAIIKVAKAKTLADFVIVMPHVGGQFNPGPAAYAKHVVKAMKDAGADMVIAGHPHVSQRCAKWKAGEVFVCYSLGNLCFTPDVGFFVPNVLSEYGIVLHAYIDVRTKKLTNVTFDIVKNIVAEDGCTSVVPVVDLLAKEQNAAQRDRLLMENEAVVNRFRNTGDDITPQREYSVHFS